MKINIFKNNCSEIVGGMRYFLIIVSMLCPFGLYAQAQEEPIHIAVSAVQHEKISILLGTIGDVSLELQEIISTIASDFQMTEQCTVMVQNFSSLQKKSQIKDLYTQKYYIAIFIIQDKNGLSWRLYDTYNAEMVAGKNYEKKGTIVRGWAHNLADLIWQEFMGTKSCFSSKIAYCKQLWVKHNGQDKVYKHVYIADADGKHVRPLVQVPTICIAPRWSNQAADPILFY